jgi:hypothetical protein
VRSNRRVGNTAYAAWSRGRGFHLAVAVSAVVTSVICSCLAWLLVMGMVGVASVDAVRWPGSPSMQRSPTKRTNRRLRLPAAPRRRARSSGYAPR